MEVVRVKIPSLFSADVRQFISTSRVYTTPDIWVFNVLNKAERVNVVSEMFGRLFPIQKELDENRKLLTELTNAEIINGEINKTQKIIEIGIKLPLLIIRILDKLGKGEQIDECLHLDEVQDFQRGINQYKGITAINPSEYSTKIGEYFSAAFKGLNFNPEIIRTLLRDKRMFLVSYIHIYDFVSLDLFASTATPEEFEKYISKCLMLDIEGIRNNKEGKYKIYFLVMMICYYQGLNNTNIIPSDQLFGFIQTIIPCLKYEYLSNWYSISMFYQCSAYFIKLFFMMEKACISTQIKETPSAVIIPFDGQKLGMEVLYKAGLKKLIELDNSKTEIPTSELHVTSGHCFVLSKQQNSETERRDKRARSDDLSPPMAVAVKQRTQFPTPTLHPATGTVRTTDQAKQ